MTYGANVAVDVDVIRAHITSIEPGDILTSNCTHEDGGRSEGGEGCQGQGGGEELHLALRLVVWWVVWLSGCLVIGF